MPLMRYCLSEVTSHSHIFLQEQKTVIAISRQLPRRTECEQFYLVIWCPISPESAKVNRNLTNACDLGPLKQRGDITIVTTKPSRARGAVRVAQ